MWQKYIGPSYKRRGGSQNGLELRDVIYGCTLKLRISHGKIKECHNIIIPKTAKVYFFQIVNTGGPH